MPAGPDEAVLADGPDSGRRPARRLQGNDRRSVPRSGVAAQVPLEFRVRSGTLDPVDIPAGPFGFRSASPGTATTPGSRLNQLMAEKSLRKMREYGFTAFSGLPSIPYNGFKSGKPVLDFAHGRSPDETCQGSGVPGGRHLWRRCLGHQRLSPGHRSDELPPGSRIIPRSSRPFTPRSRTTPTGADGSPSTITSATSRAATTSFARRRMPRRTGGRFPRGRPTSRRRRSFTGDDRQIPAFRLSKALTCVRLERPRRGCRST